MAPNINGTSQKWHLTAYIIGFLKYYQPPASRTYPSTIRQRRVIGISLWSGKSLILKSHDHDCESYNKCKNSLLKIAQPSPWQI